MAEVQASQDRGSAVLAVTAAMISLSTVFVVLRFISRIGFVKKISVDDYFMMAAWAISFGLSFSICYATAYGLGRHELDIPFDHRATLYKLEYAFLVLYNPSLMATKTSILVFYLTLSKGQKVFKWATIGTMAVVNGAGLALTFLNIFQCRPLNAVFAYPQPASANCTDIVTLYLSSAPINIVTDLVILLLPIPVIKSMRLPRKQKIILHVTFGFGVFVAVVDVVRISFLQEASVTKLEDVLSGQVSNDSRRNQERSDFSWYAAYTFLWSAVEVNVGICCASVPALKPLASAVLPQMIRDTIHSAPETPKRDTSGTANSPGPLHSPTIPVQPRPPSIADSESGTNGVNHQSTNQQDFANLNFITTPNQEGFPSRPISALPLERTDTAMTDASNMTERRPSNFWDFMNIGENKSIVQMTNRESVKPIAQVTALFVLWGFAYGLLNSLNEQIQRATHETTEQGIGTHSAYYVGYFFAPVTFGRIVLKRWGFKACYQIGLAIYGTGTLIFWPAAVVASFPGFLVCNFVIGLGLATLEVAANPFIVLCGPSEYGEMRLQLSQAFQACGTVVSHVLAKKALFANVLDAPSLIDAQWTYLALSLFTFVLSFVYQAIQLPEVSDMELEEAAEQCHLNIFNRLRKTKVIWITLGMGVMAQFFYVGVQESVNTSIDKYILEVDPQASTVNYEVIGLSLFALSRFISAGAGFIFTPQQQLNFFFVGAIIFSVLAMNFSGVTSGIMVMGIYFFEGPLFALIFAMPLRGLGRKTRLGSTLITAAISGGAVFPGILDAVARTNDYQYSYCVLVAVLAFGAIMPIYFLVTPLARQQCNTRSPQAEARDYSVAKASSWISKTRVFSNLSKRMRPESPSSDGEAASNDASKTPPTKGDG